MYPITLRHEGSQARAKQRNKLMKAQGNKCEFCGTLLRRPPAKAVRDLPINAALFPPGFFKNPIHLHHDHSTNQILGVVHAKCNAVLWQYFKQ